MNLQSHKAYFFKMLHVPHFVCLVFFIISTNITAEALHKTFVFTIEQRDIKAEQLSYYADSSQMQGVAEVLEKYMAGAFEKSLKSVPNLGYTKNVIWFHLAVKNMSKQDELIFEIDFAQYNELDLYITNDDFQLVDSLKQGVYNLRNQHDPPHRCPLFFVSCTNDSLYHLFFKIRNEAPVIIPLQVHTNQTFLHAEKKRREFSYALFGLLLATILYNFIFFFITKNNSYIYLSLHLLFSLGNFIFYAGYGYEYFPKLNPDFLIMVKFYFFSLSGLFHILFIIKYLELVKNKLFYRILQINLGYFIILFMACVSGFFSVLFIAKAAVYTYLFSPLINMFIALILFKKSRNARYYAIAYGIHILAAFTFTLTTIGVLPFSVINLNIQVIAMALLGVLLSIGLTEQFTLTKVIKATNLQLENHNRLLKSEIDVRIKTQEALSESENKFRLLFELLPHPALLTDIETGLVIDVNKAVSQVSGFEREELLNIPTTELGFWDKETRTAYMLELVRYGKISGKQMLMKMKNNKQLDVLMYSDVIIINNQRKLLTLVVDISEIKEQARALENSEKQLRQLNKTKDKFFSVIAHDLQNPLNVLMAYSKELISQLNVNNTSKAEEYSETIKKITENTGNLIQNLLSWARVQTGLIKYNPESFRALSLLENELLQSGYYFKNKKILLTHQCPADLIINGDINMLGTILRNLLSNALKFTSAGGSVSITMAKEQEFFIINVTDSGKGIAENIKRNLFKIGEIVQTKGTNDELGTGLGLILCAEFISLHKGKIEVESTLGKGSSFTVKWPVK